MVINKMMVLFLNVLAWSAKAARSLFPTITLIRFLVEILYSLLIENLTNPERRIAKYTKVSKILFAERNSKIAIVTGANSGIGYETAKALGQAGYMTILGCRNLTLGRKALREMQRETVINDRYCLLKLDLSSFESINEFVDSIYKIPSKELSILVNNAGLSGGPYSTTEGIESQFGVNHIGHFLLTTKLIPLMKKSESARIINVSSSIYYRLDSIDYSLVLEKSRYNTVMAYANSKLANAVFTCALARRLSGSRITVNSLHPGFVKTNIVSRDPSSPYSALLVSGCKNGALTSIYLALDQGLSGVSGKYFLYREEGYLHPAARDIEEQDKLWSFSEKIISEHSK